MCAALLLVGGCIDGIDGDEPSDLDLEEAEQAAVVQTWSFDFGNTSTPGYVNVPAALAGGGELLNVVDSAGATTAVDLAITESFQVNEVNTVGTTSPPASLGFPASATRDSFFGTAQPFNGQVAHPRSTVQWRGLDPAATYDIVLYASRMNTDWNLEVVYGLSGATSYGTRTLNVANNLGTSVVFKNTRPSGTGVLSLTVQKGAGNSSPAGAHYLGAARLTRFVNLVPTVSAGSDRSLAAGTTAVTLTGTASDSDGSIASYAWTKLSGNTVTMTGAATAQVAISGLAAGSYTFRLTVKDDRGASKSDDVAVTVAGTVAYGTQIQVRKDTTRFGATPPPNGYLEYLPSRYTIDTAKEWPTIIFLEGMGQRGNGTTELGRMDDQGLPFVIKNGAFKAHDKFVVLSMQHNSNATRAMVEAFLAWAVARYRIDTDRVYWTGLSMGAVNGYDYQDAAGTAGKFAAFVLISGNETSNPSAWKTRPLWIFHGSADAHPVTPVQHSIDNQVRINAIAPIVPVKLTVFPGTNHSGTTWNAVYDLSRMGGVYDTRFQPFDQSIYDWLLQYHL